MTSVRQRIRKWVIYALLAGLVALALPWLTVQGRIEQAIQISPQPQAILVLGGGQDREPYAAQLACHYPDIPIWVSTGMHRQQAETVFQSAGVPLSRLHLDYRATDTVTNFTTLVADLKARHIRHLFIVTSDFHMRRAQAIAFWVLGSRGIAYTPAPVLSQQRTESTLHVWRDVARSWAWLLTGHTGSSLDPKRIRVT